MSSLHTIDLADPRGAFVTSLNDFTHLECTLSEKEIGSLVLMLPPSYPDNLFQRDCQITYIRTAMSSQGQARAFTLMGDAPFLVQRKRHIITPEGDRQLIIHAAHPLHLIGRRVIAYDEATTETDKTGTADDLAKAIVRENFTAATDTARNWSSSIFSVAADVSLSRTVRIECSYRDVLDAIRELCAQAFTEGTYTGCTVFYDGGAFIFRTYINQKGTDRSSTSTAPLVLSTQNGALTGAEIDEDWTNAVSFVYAGGMGTLDERQVGTWEDTALTAESPYGRYEEFVNQTQTEVTLMLEGVAKRRLYEMRPRRTFTATVHDTEKIAFGANYGWGDLVVGEMGDVQITASVSSIVQFDCRVDPVRVVVDRTTDVETGKQIETETLDVKLRSIN